MVQSRDWCFRASREQEQATRLHGPGGVRGARSPAPHCEQQGGPPGSARPGGKRRSGQVVRRAARRVGAAASEDLAGRPLGRPHRDPRQFFGLGGHSLLGVRMFARLEEELGVPLPLAMLFEGPSIAQLATLLREQKRLTPSQLLAFRAFGGGRPVRYMEDEQPWYGLHLPSRSKPWPRSTSIVSARCSLKVLISSVGIPLVELWRLRWRTSYTGRGKQWRSWYWSIPQTGAA
jgi:Phosphopantetheine attachment site